MIVNKDGRMIEEERQIVFDLCFWIGCIEDWKL